jgi:hypothetical protein
VNVLSWKRVVLSALTLAMTMTIVPGAPASQADAAGLDAETARSNPQLTACYGPCVRLQSRTDSEITIAWGAPPDYPELSEFYNVRWSYPGVAETQVDVGPARSFRLDNPNKRATYTFSVEGCKKNLLARSDCSPWQALVVRAPDICLEGYFWRMAREDDRVCVTRETRDQAAYDNSQAAARRNPNGYLGLNTCINGYVWREAFPGDVVCVTPATREATRIDNSQAASRRAR